MKIFVMSFVGLVVMPVSSWASSAENCAAVVDGISQAATAVRKMATVTKSIDIQGSIGRFDGQERKALEEVVKRNAEASVALAAYATQLEDTAYLMRKCSR